jgi:hypothetical protein
MKFKRPDWPRAPAARMSACGSRGLDGGRRPAGRGQKSEVRSQIMVVDWVEWLIGLIQSTQINSYETTFGMTIVD